MALSKSPAQTTLRDQATGALAGVTNTNRLLVDSIVSGSSGTIYSVFASVTSVLANNSANILTYTVPIGKTSYLLLVEVSGTNIATYDILVNGTNFARRRTYFGSGLEATVNVGLSSQDAYKLNAGDTVDITVMNYRPSTADFEARIQYIQV